MDQSQSKGRRDNYSEKPKEERRKKKQETERYLKEFDRVLARR
jgi:hypothetical protein